MIREAARPIPKGILNARGLINEPAKEARIRIQATNPYWQQSSILCSPFKGEISYSKENLELIFRITVGRVFDSSVGQEVVEELPLVYQQGFGLQEPERTQ